MVRQQKREKSGCSLGLVFLAFGGSAFGYILYREHQVERAVATGVPTLAHVERMEPGDCVLREEHEQCLMLTVKLYPASGATYDLVVHAAHP
jgi:hypothetical protein